MKSDMFAKSERKSAIKSRLARVLLNHPEGHLSKYRIAQLSKNKYPWTHHILKTLEKQEIIQGTKVLKFDILLRLWMKWEPPYKKMSYLIKNPLEILQKTKLEYALTTYYAENLIQDYLFPSRIDFHIKSDEKIKWHNLLSKNGLIGGGNTRIIISNEHAFYNSFERNDLNVTSIPQIIFDLYNEGGVCIESAKMLMRRVIQNVI